MNDVGDVPMLDAIVKELAPMVQAAWPANAEALTIHEHLPEAIGKVPAVIFWLPDAQIPWPRDVLYDEELHVQVRTLWGRASAPQSDKAIRAMIEPFRRSLDKSGTLHELQSNADGWKVKRAGLTGWRYGVVQYGQVQYLGLTLMTRVDVTVVSGEVA